MHEIKSIIENSIKAFSDLDSYSKKDLNGNSVAYKKGFNFIIIIVSIIFAIIKVPKYTDSFNEALIGFISIFIGLFMSILIMFNDQLSIQKLKKDELDSDYKSDYKQIRRNYLLKFNSQTIVTIIISIAIFITILPYYSYEILNMKNHSELLNKNEPSLTYKIKHLLSFIYNIGVNFLLITFFKKLLFLVAEFYTYLKSITDIKNIE